jgi:hypothetical protein
MAIAVANVIPMKLQPALARTAEVTLSGSYTTGGETLIASDLKLSLIRFMSVVSSAGYTAEYDYTNSKLKILYGNTDAADGPNIEIPAAAYPAGLTGNGVLHLFVVGV